MFIKNGTTVKQYVDSLPYNPYYSFVVKGLNTVEYPYWEYCNKELIKVEWVYPTDNSAESETIIKLYIDSEE